MVCQLNTYLGLHSTEVAFTLFTLQPEGSILSVPEKKCFKVSEIFRRRWFEESGQKLDNVNRTHLVLASATKSK